MSWPDFWVTPNWKTQLLKPLSALVCYIAKRRWQQFCAQKTPSHRGTSSRLPVCVIGNIVVGGSGKTPFILGLVRAAQARGIKVGIVSRGYGGKSASWPQRVFAESDPNLVGDEPVMLAKALGAAVPIAVSPKRQQAVELLSQTTDCDWLISDDGLQHYDMPRICEIVLVDSVRGFGNGYCLPAGPLREPLNKLSQVDAVVLNGLAPVASSANSAVIPTRLQQGSTPQSQFDHSAEQAFSRLCHFKACASPKLLGAMALQGVALVNLQEDMPVLPLASLQGAKVHAVAGIGNPERFFDTLRALGAKVEAQAFSDHYVYRTNDLARFATHHEIDQSFAREKNLSLHNGLIMTQKDAVKCRSIAQQLNARNWWYLQVESHIESSVFQKIFDKMQRA